MYISVHSSIVYNKQWKHYWYPLYGDTQVSLQLWWTQNDYLAFLTYNYRIHVAIQLNVYFIIFKEV